MKTLILKRIDMRQDATLGVLLNGDTSPLLTIERPWLNNQHDISCIPSGSYLCKRTITSHLGEVFQVTDVSDRDGIFIHKANYASELEGCIAVGMQFGAWDGVIAILQSGIAFNAFMNSMQGEDEFMLGIIECI